MKAKGIVWCGVASPQFESTIVFFRDVLGLELVEHREESAFAMFRLPSGQYFEVLGGANPWHKLLERPVIGFHVDDVPSARRELEEEGVIFVSETGSNAGFEWALFEGPDGFIYEILSVPEDK